MITLYGFPLSDNARKVHWALEELGLPYEYAVVDLVKGEHKKPAFGQISPTHRVPVLDDDGFRLFESNAILWYLADAYGKGRLLPEEPRARAVVQQWLAYQGCHYGQAIERPWRMKVVAHLIGEPFDAAELTRMQTSAHEWLGPLDKSLAGKDYVAADRFTIADIALAEPTGLAADGGVDLERYANVRRWFLALSTRPAFVKTRPR